MIPEGMPLHETVTKGEPRPQVSPVRRLKKDLM